MFFFVNMQYMKNIGKRNKRTIACKSTCGFQSESNKITMSAVAKLIPKPPALVLNINMNFSLFGMLNSFI